MLAGISNSAKTIPTSLSFCDIAGLVAGASKGEGLGNQFLANIRECDAIVRAERAAREASTASARQAGVPPQVSSGYSTAL